MGLLKIPVNSKQFYTVEGGPYMRRPTCTYGVKMAKEIDRPYSVSVPTVDFQTPPIKALYRGLHNAIDAMLQGKPLYVGCMGGVGRTGLFMACLAKTFGVKEPVKYVREHYNGHAVETAMQEKFVRDFRVTPALRRKVNRAKLLGWCYFWRKNLTNPRVNTKLTVWGRLVKVIVFPKRAVGNSLDKRVVKA